MATADPSSTAVAGDDKIAEWQIDALRLLAADPADDLGGGIGHRVNGYLGFQVNEKLAALPASFG